MGLVLAGAGFLFPKILKPIFLLLTVTLAPIGMLLSELALLLIYFVVFLLGIAFRIFKRDELQLRIDRETGSYWQAKNNRRIRPDIIVNYENGLTVDQVATYRIEASCFSTLSRAFVPPIVCLINQREVEFSHDFGHWKIFDETDLR